MKKLNNIFLIGLSVFFFSCVDDKTLVDEIEATPNLVGFSNASMPMSAIADGEEYDFAIQMQVKGPRLNDMEGPVTATLSIDPASTAVEGTHFRLDSKEITISPDDNYLGLVPITLLTTGIAAPLDENPFLLLNVESTSGDGSVIANGKPIQINMLYLCPHDLTGTYTVTNSVCGSSITTQITKNADGSWHIGTADGGLLQFCSTNSTLVNSGDIQVVCSVVQATNTLTYGTGGSGNGIGDITGGTWDEETGVLTLNHTDAFFSWSGGAYTSTYTRN